LRILSVLIMVWVLVHSDGLEMIGCLKSWVDNRTNTISSFQTTFLRSCSLCR